MLSKIEKIPQIKTGVEKHNLIQIGSSFKHKNAIHLDPIQQKQGQKQVKIDHKHHPTVHVESQSMQTKDYVSRRRTITA